MPIARLYSSDKMKEFYVEEGEILYDALERQGHELPHGCLAGSCGACRIEVLEGERNLEKPSARERQTIDDIAKEKKNGPKALRLSCRAKMGKKDVGFRPC